MIKISWNELYVFQHIFEMDKKKTASPCGQIINKIN